MKLTREQRTEAIINNGLLSHLILHGLTNALSREEINEFAKDIWGSEKDIEIKLTIDNIEIDLQEFIDHWQSEVNLLIENKAQELIDGRFRDFFDSIYELEEEVKNKFEKIVSEILTIQK